MTKEFDARNEKKSRSVCAAMAESADTGKRVLSERERAILDMWPKFGDGEYAWIGDAVEAHHGGAITIEAIEFSRGKVCVKDDEDGDWDTSMYAMHPLKRPAPKVLDADGVEIKVGDTVWHHSGFAHGVVTSIDAGSLMGTVRYVNGGVEFRDAAKDLTHARPDSWERLEEDAREFARDNQLPHDVDQMERDAVDLIRRAKKLAGVE